MVAVERRSDVCLGERKIPPKAALITSYSMLMLFSLAPVPCL